MCCDPALPLLPTAIESRSGTGTLPQACGLNRSRTSTHIPIPRTVSADRLLIFSLSENRRGTIFRSSAPPKPRLPAGQMRSPVSFFHNLSQVPVDLAAHIRYTGLAFFGSFSHIHFKRKRRTGQPFLAALFVFFTFFLQRAQWVTKNGRQVFDDLSAVCADIPLYGSSNPSAKGKQPFYIYEYAT